MGIVTSRPGRGCQDEDMSDLERSPSRMPRRTREQRAYRLVVAGGGFGVVAVVGVILAIAGVIGLGLPVIAAAVSAVCFLLFRRTVSS
jgi:hypothetical protein